MIFEVLFRHAGLMFHVHALLMTCVRWHFDTCHCTSLCILILIFLSHSHMSCILVAFVYVAKSAAAYVHVSPELPLDGFLW